MHLLLAKEMIVQQGLRYLEQVQACDTLIHQHQLQLSEAADLPG
jgi:hypothetical protein